MIVGLEEVLKARYPVDAENDDPDFDNEVVESKETKTPLLAAQSKWSVLALG